MTQMICSPSKYIQGKGELSQLGRYCAQLGAKGAYAIVDPYILSVYGQEVADSFERAALPVVQHEFRGECSMEQVEQLIGGLDAGIGVIVGIGGGKTLDTAKAVSHFAELPVVLVPTVASTDAPCSALSVLYTEDGQLDRYLHLRRSPDVVVADVDIIAKAPARLLAAGMGDALSTYYEARACRRSGAVTEAGGTGSIAAFALAGACRDTLLAYGAEALRDCREGIGSDAVGRIVEANIYLSGIGFESGGLAAAHAIHNGLTVLEECRHVLHGEKVAFTTLVQLMLEQAPQEEIVEVISFCRMAGLPFTLSQLGLSGTPEERLMTAAEASCAEDNPMGNMPFTVTPQQVLDAILAADRRGQQVLEGDC
ncbi:glycerol dehydrogenase [Paenibacillus helianthi]|uniref:Glycerol dehydrogenase n=1 Tax=Paenibacillus helianthi TaxID=1349432 RepID=A0ABX3EGX0_9BACL|nr:glycerol dehydrogenase [Paenibacillus helianthi]OKP80747.1 glycerol dehydrogenase [Paenibacillus helianthi]